MQRHVVPEWIAHDEECHVFGLRVSQDLVAVGLDRLAVGDYDGSAIEALLLLISVSPRPRRQGVAVR